MKSARPKITSRSDFDDFDNFERIELSDCWVTPNLRRCGTGHNLLVERHDGLCYNVDTELEGRAMQRFAAGLKPPTEEVCGVSFKHHSRMLYLTEDMERLLGIPFVEFHEFQVARVFNERTRFVLGRFYTPALDPDRPALWSEVDERLNHDRMIELHARWRSAMDADGVYRPGC